MYNKLEKLGLQENAITDINILQKLNFKELRELYLYNNNISDLEVLKQIKLEKLEKLDLEDNKIDKNKNGLIISNLKFSIKEFFK